MKPGQKKCGDALVVDWDEDFTRDWTTVYCELPLNHKCGHKSGTYEWPISILEKICGYEIYGPQGLIGFCDRKSGHADNIHTIKGKYGIAQYPVAEGY